MTELEKIKIFAEIVDCPAEEITAQTNLQDIPEWDSLYYVYAADLQYKDVRR